MHFVRLRMFLSIPSLLRAELERVGVGSELSLSDIKVGALSSPSSKMSIFLHLLPACFTKSHSPTPENNMYIFF